MISCYVTRGKADLFPAEEGIDILTTPRGCFGRGDLCGVAQIPGHDECA
jgi:hypothetical protein